MKVYQFRRRDSHPTPNALFFTMPEWKRHARIREMTRTGLTAAQIASVCHVSVNEVASVLAQPSGAA